MELLLVFSIAMALLFIGWCLFGLLLLPVFRKDMVTLCFEKDSGQTLENQVRAFGWLRDGKGGTFLIVDCGLNREGLMAAQHLQTKYPWVEYCPAPALTDYIELLQDTI